jgi:galactonate dehydratase
MSRTAKIDAYVLTVPRDEPYLGGLHPGEVVNRQGYFVRKRNRTAYPVVDRSVILRLETASGVVGWGETYGLIAPRAVLALIDDFLAEFVLGRDVFDATAIHDDLYDLMRCRGYTGGFYLDALAAIDIALWDAAGRCAGKSVAELLGGSRRDTIPAYVSGLPKRTLKERAELACAWRDRGFDSFKFAAPMAEDNLADEIAGLRSALGPSTRIACDLHWAWSSADAILQIKSMEAHDLWFAEAPVAPESVPELAAVARAVGVPVAAGEEWRTVHDARARIDAGAVAIVQPEMGHTGITEFMRIGRAAQAQNLQIIPHATIGSGLFLAASLQASCALETVAGHEFQHSIFGRSAGLITAGMACAAGAYRIAPGPGLGIEPAPEMIARLER